MSSVSYSLVGDGGFLVTKPLFPHQYSSYWPPQLNDWKENSIHISLMTVGNFSMRQYSGKSAEFQRGLVASWRKRGLFPWATT